MLLKSALAVALSAAILLAVWFLLQRADVAEAPAAAAATQEDYAARDWDEGQFEKLNISLYTFSDNNRNGRYDQGDRPMAAIAVHLTRPDGSMLTARSNINGYANFSMLFEGAAADIAVADGDYQFAVSIPPGWRNSTSNALQAVHFVHLPGSISGLMAENPPAVVGLMPELRVTGRIASTAKQQLLVIAVGPDGARQAIPLDENKGFSFEVHPGQWLLEVSDTQTGRLSRRSFQVANAPLQLSAIDLTKSNPDPLAIPVLEDFEGLQRSTLEKLPGGRSGLGWDFLIAVDNQYYGGPGYANALQSGRMVAYNSSGHPVTITPDVGQESFDFVGAYIAVAWPAAQGEQLLVQAWRQGRVVGREEITLSYLGPVWFQGDYHQIDRLELSSAHYWQFVVDDMVFRVSRESGIPDAH